MKISRSVSLWVAAVAGCALLALLSLSPALLAKEMVPYRGVGWGAPLEISIVWPTPEDPDGSAIAVLEEIGEATYFGEYRARLECEGYFVLEGEGENQVMVLLFAGTYVQEAADGSSVTAWAMGREPLLPAPTPFTVEITIIEGTGRFEGATGSWEMSALSTGDYTYTTEGMISSIGSARSGH